MHLRSRHARLVAIVDARFSGGMDDPSRSPVPARAAFVLVLAVYAAYQLLTNGQEILGGGMWAELALVYYPAHDLPVLQQLLAGDAGYLPLPQRLLSLPLSLLDVSASVYPYYYAAVATLGAGMLVATLCLPSFRPLIASDGLRLALALVLLSIADVNTRAFTNFVYFAVVPLMAVTALALTGRREIPRWTWVLPVFMISKPAMLAALPMMVLVAVVREGRFRAITIASSVCAAGQLLYVSQQSARLVDPTSPDVLRETLHRSPWFVLGFIGRWAVDAVDPPDARSMIVAGLVVVALSVMIVASLRTPGSALVLVALTHAALAIVVNVPVIVHLGQGLTPVADPVLPFRDRVHIGAILSIVLVVGGGLAAATQAVLRRRTAGAMLRPLSAALAVVLLVGWFGMSGWAERASTVATPQGLPRMGVSQFVRLAAVLDNPGSTACVPVDGPWMLGRRCTTLVGIPNPDPNDIVLRRFRGLPHGATLRLDVPAQVVTGGLSSFALMLRPSDRLPQLVGARAVLTLTDGSEVVWTDGAAIPPSGGLLQLSSPRFAPVAGVRSIEVRLDRSVDLAITTASWQPAEQIQVTWMGSTPEMLAAG